MALVCTVCLDDLEQDVDNSFTCITRECNYTLCTSCAKRAFEDSSGQSYKKCSLCKNEIARDILEAILGVGAVKAVENELRLKVELDVRDRIDKREVNKLAMKTYENKAASLFNQLTEDLNLKCPRCKQVFYDYDGCNALSCSNVDCKAGFCALCLQDCGRDAHQHIASAHGNLFDRKAFIDAKKKREMDTASSFLAGIQGEPFEVRQMVKNLYSDTISESAASRSGGSSRAFLVNARQQLRHAVQHDRLGVLRDPGDQTFAQRGLRLEDVSPRSKIPPDYKLELLSAGENVYNIVFFSKAGVTIDGRPRWQSEQLPSGDEQVATNSDRRQVDVLSNLLQSLKCCVLAFQGARRLYQSSFVPVKKDRSL